MDMEMLSPILDKDLCTRTARAEIKDPFGLVDLPHPLLVLVLRWVEALTPPNYPGNVNELTELKHISGEVYMEAVTDIEADRVSWLVATFLGCESLCSALRSAVQDDAVWLGLSRRCHGDRKVQPSPLLEEEEVHEPTKWMEANDRYTPTESGHASCRESVLVVCCMRAIRAEQLEVGLMSPGGGSFWAAVGMALWTRNPISAVGIVLTHKTACALGQMLEDDLLRHMEQAHLLAIHRTDNTSCHIAVVNKADLDLLAIMISMQPGTRTQHSYYGPTPFRIGAISILHEFGPHDGRPFDTPLLAKLCPEEFGLATQAAMIQRCARRAGIVKYTDAFAEAIWTRLLQRTAGVLQRCAVAMTTTNLPHEPAVWSLDVPGAVEHHQPIFAPPPHATFAWDQANNPFGPVEDDNSDEDDEDDEGEGEELTETEDEDESWRVQVRVPATHAEIFAHSFMLSCYIRVVTGAATEGDQSGR